MERSAPALAVGAATTLTLLVIVDVQPACDVTVSVVENVPLLEYECVGLDCVEVNPSPKSHWNPEMLPEVMLEVFENNVLPPSQTKGA